MRRTFEEDNRSNNSDSETDSSTPNSINERAEGGGNKPDSRFYQKVGHLQSKLDARLLGGLPEEPTATVVLDTVRTPRSHGLDNYAPFG